jgi:hypothetical protein
VHIAANYLNEVLGNTALIDKTQRNKYQMPYAPLMTSGQSLLKI